MMKGESRKAPDSVCSGRGQCRQEAPDSFSASRFGVSLHRSLQASMSSRSIPGPTHELQTDTPRPDDYDQADRTSPSARRQEEEVRRRQLGAIAARAAGPVFWTVQAARCSSKRQIGQVCVSPRRPWRVSCVKPVSADVRSRGGRGNAQTGQGRGKRAPASAADLDAELAGFMKSDDVAM